MNQVSLTSIVQGSIERGWDRKSGHFTVIPWTGTQAQVEAKRIELVNSGAYTSVDVRQIGGGVWEVKGRTDSQTDGNNNPQPQLSVVDTWELTANRVEKDILDSSVTSDLGIADADIKKLRDYLEGKKAFDTDAWDGGGGNAQSLYVLLKNGVKSFTVSQPVLRKTQSVSSGYVLGNSLTNVEAIYTTASLRSSEAIPASISNNLPNSSTVTYNGLSFRYGWLKHYPTITDAVDARIQLQQEFEWGLWATLLYNTA